MATEQPSDFMKPISSPKAIAEPMITTARFAVLATECDTPESLSAIVETSLWVEGKARHDGVELEVLDGARLAVGGPHLLELAKLLVLVDEDHRDELSVAHRVVIAYAPLTPPRSVSSWPCMTFLLSPRRRTPRWQCSPRAAHLEGEISSLAEAMAMPPMIGMR